MISRKHQIWPFVGAVLLFLFCNPYFVWDLWHTGNIKLIMTGIISILFFLHKDIRSNGRNILFVLLLLLLSFTSLINDQNLIGFIAAIMTCVLPFARIDFANKTFDYFLTIYSIIIGISAFTYILSLFGLAPILGTIEPLNILKSYDYTIYPLLVIANDIGESSYRFFGPFDEPGVIGTISAILLVIGKFNLKDKRYLIIFITGFFSLSFFYFIVVSIYYLIYNLFVKKNRRNSIFIIVVFFIFLLLTYNNTILHNILWSRFEWDPSTGRFVGDNRLTDMGYEYVKTIMGSSEFYFGSNNYEVYAEMVSGSSSFISIIVQYGLIFSLLYVYLFASYGWKYKQNIITYLLFLFVFLGTVYQRPFIFDPLYLFLFSMMAISCESQKKYN